MDNSLAILLLIPIIIPFIAKRIWHNKINFTEMLIQIVLVCCVVWVVWTLGEYGQTTDVEIWNGYVVSKDRIHDQYTRTYECNCTTTYSGTGKNRTSTRTCQTCYEEHYTVTWVAETTVGDIQFDHLDRTSRSVYNADDPVSYLRCKVGEPASAMKTYINYVQAVPNSLFNNRQELATLYGDLIPTYPTVYNFYRINRVLNVNANIPGEEVQALNAGLNEHLKQLGAMKQVNVVVILTEIDDQMYRYAVENQWLGGKKNDVIVFLGLDDNTLTWVDIMTFALNSGNEIFHVQLRDALRDLKTFQAQPMADVIANKIAKHFDRFEMATLKALENEIDPPTWVIILAAILSIGGSVGMTFVFHKYHVDDVVTVLVLAIPGAIVLLGITIRNKAVRTYTNLSATIKRKLSK